MNLQTLLNDYPICTVVQSGMSTSRCAASRTTRAFQRRGLIKVESPEPEITFELARLRNEHEQSSPKSRARASCLWCHKIELKRKLKRGVTFVVGRPRQGWVESGLPLLYTCCSCYEQGRKGRNLDHKMDTLKAQYTAFDEYGIQFYECKKRVGKTWVQWIATSQQVWQELNNAYQHEKSFDGIKAIPILDLAAFGHQKGKTHLRSKREPSEESSVMSLQASACSDDLADGTSEERSGAEESDMILAAKALTELCTKSARF